MKEKIIIPLDGMSREASLQMAEKLRGKVWGFKVNDLLTELGVSVIRELSRYGRVFADPKFHDIPNTVANQVKRMADSGATLITVHASGGKEMLAQAVKNAGDAKILAVTVLTSLKEEMAKQIFGKSVAATVVEFAEMAQECGVHGIVCSPKELSLLHGFPNLLKVTPGVRPGWYQQGDDQQRTLSPRDAVRGGADFLVIGRPITGHASPAEAVDLVLQELHEP